MKIISIDMMIWRKNNNSFHTKMKKLASIIALILSVLLAACNRQEFIYNIEGDSETISGINEYVSGKVIIPEIISHYGQEYVARKLDCAFSKVAIYNETPIHTSNTIANKHRNGYSAVSDTIDEVMTIDDSPVKVHIEYELSIEHPRENSQYLSEAINNYIFNKPILNSDFETECRELMIRKYVATWGNEENQYNYWAYYTIANETDKYVTYQSYIVEETGGIHANYYRPFITIAKNDGHIVRSALRDGVNVSYFPHIIRKGLTRFYQQKYNELLLDTNDIKFPRYAPALVGDSIAFQYDRYDGYGLDMPEFRIHVDELRPYLSDEILLWIEK